MAAKSQPEPLGSVVVSSAVFHFDGCGPFDQNPIPFWADRQLRCVLFRFSRAEGAAETEAGDATGWAGFLKI